jgi:uncharacterized protein YbjT (DUF2867 family)
MTSVFLAGGTGYTGVRVLAAPGSLRFVVLLRPGSTAAVPASPAIERTERCSANDAAALTGAMRGCDTVLSLIGTTRARFESHGDYETVDYGTTLALLEAAREAGAKHFVLLSALGAGAAVGAYLKWKRKAELAVIDSGIPYTIVRPSFITGPGRVAPPGLDGVLKLAGKLPGLGGVAEDWRSIPVTDLAAGFVRILERRGPLGAILQQRDFFPLLK